MRIVADSRWVVAVVVPLLACACLIPPGSDDGGSGGGNAGGGSVGGGSVSGGGNVGGGDVGGGSAGGGATGGGTSSVGGGTSNVGGGTSNGGGTPQGCNAPTECPAANDCQAAPTCDNHVCHYAPLTRGTACALADKCNTSVCDGAGTCVGTPVVCSNPPDSPVPTSCPSGTTFPVKLGGVCNTTCNPSTGCVYGDTMVPCPTGSNTLPQKHGYQVVLRNALATLTASDFDVSDAGLSWKPSYASSMTDDELYRLWLAVHYDTNQAQLPGFAALLKVPASSYLLSTMESTKKYQVGTEADVDPIAMFFYRDWNYPGNPWHGSRGAMLRAFAVTSADMIRMDNALGKPDAGLSSWPDSLDNLSGAPLNYGYVGARIRDEASLDVCTRAAFQVGVRHMFNWFEGKNTSLPNNGDMLIAQAEAFAYMADALGDAPTRARAEQKIVTQMAATGEPEAGFTWHAGGGFDAYYEGWTQNHLTAAALWSKWDSAKRLATNVHNTRSYLSFPQKETLGPSYNRYVPCMAPSAASPATPFTTCGFGGDYGGGRDYGTAMLNDEALYLVDGLVDGGVPDRAYMMADVASSRGLERAIDFHGGSSTAMGLSTWDTRHYPRGVSSGVLFYVPGTYDHFKNLKQSNPEYSLPPVMRTADYVKMLGESTGGRSPQFFVAKLGGANGFAVAVHTGTVSTTISGGPAVGTGMGGGALDAFWTKQQRTVLLAWNHGRNYNASVANPAEAYTWDNWKKWSGHVLSGRSGTTIFSSGSVRQPAVTYDLSVPNQATIGVSADLNQGASVSATGLPGHLNYTRNFVINASGVTIDTSLKPGTGTAPVVDELYEILPVFIRYGVHATDGMTPGIEDELTPTTITVRTVGTSTFVPLVVGTRANNVDRIRLERYGGTVEISFNEGHTLDLMENDVPMPVAGTAPIEMNMKTQSLLIGLGQTGGALVDRTLHYTISKL